MRGLAAARHLTGAPPGVSSTMVLLMMALVALVFAFVPLANAQESTPVTAEEKESAGSPLVRGSNEFGVWAGFSPFSFKLEGQTENRKLFLLNLQYARTLFSTTPFSTTPVTLKYTAELVPVAVQVRPMEVYLVNGNNVITPAGAIYGGGASPVGFQANFGRKTIQPFANGSVGFLYFRQQVPVVDSSQFNYTVTIGFGAQFFRPSGRSFTLGWKYHHLSNNYQGTVNPGTDSSVFYAGFSFVRPRR